MGAVLVQHLVVVELAVALVAFPLARHSAWVVPGAALAVLLVAGVLPRYRGRRLALWPGIVLAFRRRRGTRRPAAAPAASDGHTPEADLAPVRECLPGLTVASATDRGGRPVGMAGDGTFLTAVLLVEARDEPLRPRRDRRPLPLAALANALRVDDVVLASAQIAQHSQPAPAPHLPPEALATRAYTELRSREGGDVPAVRQTWIALRLEPELCATAIAARGGGAEGARRTLLRAVNSLAAALADAGLACRPLDEHALTQALFTAIGANRAVRRNSRGGTRTAEARHLWRCDDRWHTTYWIGRWPRVTAGTSPDIVGALTATPGLATTFSLTAESGGGGSVGLTGHLRISARSADELARSSQQLEQQARQLQMGLVRLDWEQQPALLATLPLGGRS
ncbi:type VII secretion protein EccE [Yinghuangia aomiensis]|uniref:Type VII secretion protein EccE n=1 Tax=Yinghuangia aomiensis TaxID=676205 RepID=A0ABP9I329_9ACTN